MERGAQAAPAVGGDRAPVAAAPHGARRGLPDRRLSTGNNHTTRPEVREGSVGDDLLASLRVGRIYGPTSVPFLPPVSLLWTDSLANGKGKNTVGSFSNKPLSQKLYFCCCHNPKQFVDEIQRENLP